VTTGTRHDVVAHRRTSVDSSIDDRNETELMVLVGPAILRTAGNSLPDDDCCRDRAWRANSGRESWRSSSASADIVARGKSPITPYARSTGLFWWAHSMVSAH
jgi:hypothetical protein